MTGAEKRKEKYKGTNKNKSVFCAFAATKIVQKICFKKQKLQIFYSTISPSSLIITSLS